MFRRAIFAQQRRTGRAKPGFDEGASERIAADGDGGCRDGAYLVSVIEKVPFGLEYWDDLEGCEVVPCSDGVATKLLGDKVAFLRLQLTGEPMKVKLVLGKRRK